MLNRDPVRTGELLDDPFVVEPPKSRVLLSSERSDDLILDADIIHVGHAGLHLLGETNSAIDIACEDGRRKTQVVVVGQEK